MAKLYAILSHTPLNVPVPRETGGHHYESAEAERTEFTEAKQAVETWFNERLNSCAAKNCSHTRFVMEEIHPDEIMSGLTEGMVTI